MSITFNINQLKSKFTACIETQYDIAVSTSEWPNDNYAGIAGDQFVNTYPNGTSKNKNETLSQNVIFY